MSGILFIILLGLTISSSVAASHLPVLGATLQDIESDIFGALGEFQSYSQEEIDKHVQKIEERVTRYGYPFETHSVQTEDGYILGLHRIPYSPNNGPVPEKPVIYLQHGLLCSSNDWIMAGPGKGLAFILADLGYDVWMGNSRGNSFSKNHAWLHPKSKSFWDFSFHQIGYYDLPAMIDYILQITGESRLNYAGHSQGTLVFFIMTSLRPEYNIKIRSMHALAPVVFMGNVPNPFFRVLAPLLSQVSLLNKLLGSFEFLPSTTMKRLAGSVLCRDQSTFQPICANILFLIGGYNHDNLNYTLLSDILQVTPAGASVNQIIHYAQGVPSGKFRQYDYGILKNLLVYKSLWPPDYPLGEITAPIHLYYSNNDWLAAVKDVQILASKLQNVVYNKIVPDLTFNHFDFLWGLNVREMVYDDLIENIQRYV
ncbi:lipase 3-like [Hermetia illucens]|uniref:lipase 3-like n=1 Tax=Hermetia illucens TaxID=343691 RepID=UPI0018CBF4E1|nr:lipase 3-like [Hermetia illucens]